MAFWIRFVSGALAVWLCAVLAGCSPGQNQADQEKEPHFVLGKSLVNAMDYKGAVKAFEESLEADPRSASAHFELGWLYEQKVPDPAAAIYHYEQYLKLNPNAGNAAIIKQHIEACKQQLAADVMPLPSAPAAQQQLEKLMEQNRQLQTQVNHLKDVVRQWNAWYARQMAARTSAIPAPNSRAAARTETAIQPAQPARTAVAPMNGASAARAAPITPRTHTVVAGETAMGICRKAGVKFSAFQAANPGVNLSRIRPGQVLNLPAP